MEKFDRGERRYQVERLKAKRQWYYGHGHVLGTEGVVPMTPKQLGRVVQDAAPCSCFACGNERRHFGTRTVQEQRLFQDLLQED